MKRSCGVLLPISSLPSPYGIGTLGACAYAFVDQLASAGQSWWQILPVGPTSMGDSPYQSFSTFAGNPYFVDLDTLAAEGKLLQEEIESIFWGDDPSRVDYGSIYHGRFALLQRAAERGYAAEGEAIAAFARDNADWLPDYALFMALKRHFDMRSWTEWADEDARMHRPEALARYRQLLEGDVRLFTYIQYEFFRQWRALKAYAHEKGVGIIGDLPIYVALDSSDVWANPLSFQLDERNVPTEVSGVPPDYFSAEGQLWGNPLYNWEAMARDGYHWWLRRVEGAAALYDALRIDHFRGFESYWAVPYGESTAINGRWVKGPGMDFVGLLAEKFPDTQFIAEDLGFLTPEVKQLLKDSGMPGMKVLEFAFDSREPSDYLPHTYPRNCICYTGTHDNTPLMGWRSEAETADLAFARDYLGLNGEEGFHWGLIRGGMSSVAVLFVAQLQDYLALGAEARINTPGALSGNWQWRLLPGQLDDALCGRMRELARIYGR